MISLRLLPGTLHFKKPFKTAKQTFTKQKTYFVQCVDDQTPDKKGWGEASPIPQYSVDNIEYFQKTLQKCSHVLNQQGIPGNHQEIFKYIEQNISPSLPALRLGVEMAILNYIQQGNKKWFQFKKKKLLSNALISLDTHEKMWKNIFSKKKQGFTHIKIKISKHHFSFIRTLLQDLKKRAPEMIIRLDANGDFHPEEVHDYLAQLKPYPIQAIEQPIAPKYRQSLQKLCRQSPIPIALDESLIQADINILSTIRPHYIVLKPVYLGGFYACKQWISAAEQQGIGWWMTVGLESPLGTQAIRQFLHHHDYYHMVHGLDNDDWYKKIKDINLF